MALGEKTPRPLRIVIMGPPAAGKGTQAERIKREFGVAHLATGELLRAAVALGTPLGLEIKEAMDSGNFVPDKLIVSVVRDAIRAPEFRRGFVLDGFPRTLAQAEMLDSMLAEDIRGASLDVVLELQVPDDELRKRIVGRLVHTPSGRTYHETFRPPRVPGHDDVTGEPLSRRNDDTDEILTRRLVDYRTQTEPVIEYYRKRGVSVAIDASQSQQEVWANIAQSINRCRSC